MDSEVPESMLWLPCRGAYDLAGYSAEAVGSTRSVSPDNNKACTTAHVGVQVDENVPVNFDMHKTDMPLDFGSGTSIARWAW